MAGNYIERNIKNIKAEITQDVMATNYTNMLNKVANMIVNDGPIYSTWITLQLGINNPIKFNTSSTDPKKNLIASLRVQKSCVGVTNEFRIEIKYDPFNMGQESTDAIEQLDEYVAMSMSGDWDDNNDKMCAKIQYGYNSTSDDDLVSPCYQFFITDISSKVNFDSGITAYTISGTSEIAPDCDFTAEFSAINDWRLMDIIEWTLYYWYGDPENKPSHTGNAKPSDNPYKYRIDIPDDVYNESPIHVNVEAKSGMTPFSYCQAVLDANPLTQAEKDSGKYDDLSSLSYSQRPRYVMYITDNAGVQTIHVAHIKPSTTKDESGNEKAVEESPLKINYTFSWGMQEKNIITGWSPVVDLKRYLISKSLALRYPRLREQALTEGNQSKADEYQKKLVNINTELTEMYDAELQIVGIPADPPVTAEIRVIPRVLESVSRTAGVYVIRGCVDEITSNGKYTTTLTLFRKRSLNGLTETLSTGGDDAARTEIINENQKEEISSHTN